MKQARFDGADGAAQAGGNAFERFVHIEPQVDNLFMLGRQPDLFQSELMSVRNDGPAAPTAAPARTSVVRQIKFTAFIIWFGCFVSGFAIRSACL